MQRYYIYSDKDLTEAQQAYLVALRDAREKVVGTLDAIERRAADHRVKMLNGNRLTVGGSSVLNMNDDLERANGAMNVLLDLAVHQGIPEEKVMAVFLNSGLDRAREVLGMGAGG